jgi:hypothetical protein
VTEERQQPAAADRADEPATTWSVLRTFIGDMLVLLAIFLAMEVVVRVVAPQPVHRLLRNVWEADENGRRYTPGAHVICNNGFGDHDLYINKWRGRDKEYGPRQPGEWRVLCVGDSFSENLALEVDQIYPNVLESKLNEAHPDRTFSVVNAGMAGWGLRTYKRYIEKNIAEINPNVVVVAVEMSGDLITSPKPVKPTPMKLRFGMPVKAKASVPARMIWVIWLVNELLECHSHAFVAFRRVTRIPLLWMGLGREVRIHPICLDPEIGSRAVESTADLVRQIKDVCNAHGAPLVMIRVPRDYEVMPARSEFKIQMENPDLSKLDLTAPRKVFNRIADAAEVRFYDPSDDLAAATEQTYFPGFAHWDVNGNQIVADGLWRFLKQENLLGPPKPQPATGSAPATRKARTP